MTARAAAAAHRARARIVGGADRGVVFDLAVGGRGGGHLDRHLWHRPRASPVGRRAEPVAAGALLGFAATKASGEIGLSVTTTFVVGPVPLFCTSIVKWSGLPTSTSFASTLDDRQVGSPKRGRGRVAGGEPIRTVSPGSPTAVDTVARCCPSIVSA